MSRAQKQFETKVQEVLRAFGVDDALVDGAIGLHFGEDEVWLQVEPQTAPMRAYHRNVEPAGFQLVVRSRIYTFRRAPTEDTLARIERAAGAPPLVVYIEDKKSLYAQQTLTEPTLDGLTDTIRIVCDQARHWLDSKLFEVMRSPDDETSPAR
ncbi:MAG: hypothetical protein AAFN74_23680 [Myxococcota bacterium]